MTDYHPQDNGKGTGICKTVNLYSLANDAVDVADGDSFVTALSAPILVSIALIDMVRKPPAEPIVFAKQ